ncbi:MAG: TatD family hydrolase [Candidatus Omnitrophica bacterium]|nr:TatD family hydrolase [Candidatus Omnitrophota bacterium]
MLQDAHIHLQDCPEEAIKISAGAAGHGVGRFFCNGTYPRDWPEVMKLAGSHSNIIPFFGVHPWHIDKTVEGWDKALIEYLALPGSRIGEIGLDGAKVDVSLVRQREIFTRQLDIAVEFKKPFTVHCVQAWDALLEEIRMRKDKKLLFMVHWFSGSPEIAVELIKLGGYISFSPRLLYERALKHRASFDVTPVDRILLETDYPYTPDSGSADKPDVSKYFEWLRSLYGMAARLKKLDEVTFEQKVWDNGTVFLH